MYCTLYSTWDGERERDREREFVGWLCKCVGAWWQKPSPKGTISDEISPPEITNSRLGANVLSVKPGVWGGGGIWKIAPKSRKRCFCEHPKRFNKGRVGTSLIGFSSVLFSYCERKAICLCKGANRSHFSFVKSDRSSQLLFCKEQREWIAQDAL